MTQGPLTLESPNLLYPESPDLNTNHLKKKKTLMEITEVIFDPIAGHFSKVWLMNEINQPEEEIRFYQLHF